MRVQIEQTVTVSLILTETEALWLREQMQNPLGVHEGHSDAEMRKRFWEALNGAKDL